MTADATTTATTTATLFTIGGGGNPSIVGAAVQGETTASEDVQPRNNHKEVETTIDMERIQQVRAATTRQQQKSVIPIRDPPPLLSLQTSTTGGKNNKRSIIQIPRVGYSLYKTPPDQAERCTTLALLAGIRHFDVATQYGSNAQVAEVLQKYLNIGLGGLDTSSEKPELLQLLAETSIAGNQHAREVGGNALGMLQYMVAPPPDGSIGRRGRREGLFLHYKLSNAQQSDDIATVKKFVKFTIGQLGCTYLDMVSIHSPLTNTSTRLGTYTALLELQRSGFVRAVGVCNYGLGPLREIQGAGLDLPTMNQLELSPFQTHDDIVEWCNTRGIGIGCSAWSRLSSTKELENGWLDVVGVIASKYRVTKAQILIRWSLQKGYACVPRSSTATKIERIAIGQNSYGGVCGFVLTEEEMNMLDALNVNLKAGTLGRTDGWQDSDVTGPDWDPTDYV